MIRSVVKVIAQTSVSTNKWVHIKHIPQDTPEEDDAPDAPSESESSSSSASPNDSGDDPIVSPVDVDPIPPHVDPIPLDVPPPPLPPPSFPPDPIPPPPDPIPLDAVGPRASQIRGSSSRAQAYYFTAHGKVTFYPGSGMYEAKCTFPGHGDCRVSKTHKKARGQRLVKHPHQGRQVACLVAWLELASVDQNSSAEHRAVMPDFAARRSVRTRLKDVGVHARALLEAERDQFPTEPDSEPSDFEPFDDPIDD